MYFDNLIRKDEPMHVRPIFILGALSLAWSWCAAASPAEEIAVPKYQPTWESLKAHKDPEWFYGTRPWRVYGEGPTREARGGGFSEHKDKAFTPRVNRMLKECHIENFSIWQREIEGKLYLFAYLEYSGNNFDADMKKMAADPETQRWWKETDPCQIPLPDAAAKGKIWADLTEVYYLQ